MNQILIIENKTTSIQYTINIHKSINEFHIDVKPTQKKETIITLENSDINKIKNDVQNLESIDKKIIDTFKKLV